jgi:hypothetical protein
MISQIHKLTSSQAHRVFEFLRLAAREFHLRIALHKLCNRV